MECQKRHYGVLYDTLSLTSRALKKIEMPTLRKFILPVAEKFVPVLQLAIRCSRLHQEGSL
jgi:hypothetical protein